MITSENNLKYFNDSYLRFVCSDRSKQEIMDFMLRLNTLSSGRLPMPTRMKAGEYHHEISWSYGASRVAFYFSASSNGIIWGVEDVLVGHGGVLNPDTHIPAVLENALKKFYMKPKEQ